MMVETKAIISRLFNISNWDNSRKPQNVRLQSKMKQARHTSTCIRHDKQLCCHGRGPLARLRSHKRSLLSRLLELLDARLCYIPCRRTDPAADVQRRNCGWLLEIINKIHTVTRTVVDLQLVRRYLCILRVFI